MARKVNHFAGGNRSGCKATDLDSIKRDFQRGYSQFSGAYGSSSNVHPLTKKRKEDDEQRSIN